MVELPMLGWLIAGILAILLIALIVAGAIFMYEFFSIFWNR